MTDVIDYNHTSSTARELGTILSAPPTANYDVINGWQIGDSITDTSTGTFWRCVSNAAGAAVWTPDCGTPGTATAVSGAATLNAMKGTVTTESVSTAAGAEYTLTLTNSVVSAASIVLASLQNGTNTTVGAVIGETTAAAGSVVIKVHNAGASALNGTLKVAFVVF